MLHIYTRLKQLVFLFCCGLLSQGCNVINPTETVPTYIRIDSLHFKGNPIWPNLPVSSQITNVSVYYNNHSIGNFDLPATIPVMATGYGTLEVSAGINIDGLNNLTAVYPFYQVDTLGFSAQPGKVIKYTPVTSFYNDIKPYPISNFSGNTLFALFAGNRTMTTINYPDPMAFEGGTGSIQLSAVGDSSVDSTIKSFPIPAGAAYIEFNYKSTVPFYVGLQSNLGNVISSTPYFLGGVSPSDHWQKFYLAVQDYAAQFKGDSYNFYIKAVLDTGQTSGRLLIDNIYLITF